MIGSRKVLPSFSVPYVGTVLRAFVGDAFDAYLKPELLLEELHHRSGEDKNRIGIGHLGPAWQNWLPKMIYVAHEDPRYFQIIAGYGEKGIEEDTGARTPFDMVEILLGQKAIINLQGRAAMREKGLIKSHLNAPNKTQEIYRCAKQEFLQLFTGVSKKIQENPYIPDINTYPVQISLLVNRILAKSLFGINTQIQPWHVSATMDIARFITDPWPSLHDLRHAFITLVGISEDLLQNSTASVDPDKYISASIGLEDCATDEEKLAKLKMANIAGSLLAGTNLVDLIMKTIVELSQNDQVRNLLVDEIDQAGDAYDSLKNLPYLDNVYREAMRLFSPSFVVRHTSKLYSMALSDGKNKQHIVDVPAGSYLFAPIRPRHMDPKLWDQPERFDPSRFAGPNRDAKIRSLMTFSDGMRSCPAKFGFTEVVFKTIIAEFFRYYKKLELDRKVEEVPVFSFNTSWKEDYYITALRPRT